LAVGNLNDEVSDPPRLSRGGQAEAALLPALQPVTKIFFGNLKSVLLLLHQFFKTLSRKAEGFGPMKPWQPLQATHL